MRTWSLTPTTQMHKPTLHMDLDENMKISKEQLKSLLLGDLERIIERLPVDEKNYVDLSGVTLIRDQAVDSDYDGNPLGLVTRRIVAESLLIQIAITEHE